MKYLEKEKETGRLKTLNVLEQREIKRMIGYIVVGVTCYLIGNFVGVFVIALCIAAKERDDYQNCIRKGDDKNEERKH